MSEPASQVIAIDGPAASGKSSVAKRVAKALGYLYVNTGNMYRAVSWAVLDQGIDLQDAEAITRLLHTLQIEFVLVEGHVQVLVNGRALTDDELNSQDVNGAVSHVAKVAEVRARLVDEQRALVSHGHLVMEGRDIGSIVFPDTSLKFYIDASEEVRSARRSSQGHADAVALRDKIDSTRKNAPLIVPKGALRIDSSDMTLEQVVQQVLDVVRAAR
jgi:cytidylate kinase